MEFTLITVTKHLTLDFVFLKCGGRLLIGQGSVEIFQSQSDREFFGIRHYLLLKNFKVLHQPQIICFHKK